MIAGALTLPFDIYFAIKALDDASRTTGKQALDLYVAAGLNLTSATLTLILGTAALAGFTAAGPLGILAAAILIIGSQIYSAARQVDDIDDYIELRVDERLATGFLAFFMQGPPSDVQDRYNIAVTLDQHSKVLTNRAQKWLDGQLKDSVEAIVNGKVDVSLKASQVFWFEQDVQGRESTHSKEIKEPRVEGGDDVIDARNGIPSDLSGVVKGKEGESKATLWLLGGGSDKVIGVENKPNHFSYGSGSKHLTGGEKDDRFLFEGAEQALTEPVAGQARSHIKGGDGSDTLVFHGNLDSRSITAYDGFYIDLKFGEISRRSDSASYGEPTHTVLDSIENVETLAGARNVVMGSATANRIISRGDDRIYGDGGDDAIYMMGGNGSAEGGPGKDQYFIAHKSGTVIITEAAGEESVVIMDWPLENIQKWSIEDTSIVVSSLCGSDGELPERKLIIKNVYHSSGDKRLLQEQKLRFLTLDGFQLTPDFPEELSDSDNHDIKVIILAKGNRPAPIIINHMGHAMSEPKPSGYYIDRLIPQTAFHIPHFDTEISNTVYIDFNSTDIIEAKASYSVHTSSAYSNIYLNYSDFNLELKLPDQTIKFQDFISSTTHTYTNYKDTPFMFKGLTMNQTLILTMRDGVSYRMHPHSRNFSDDAREPGIKQLDGRQLLKERTGRYLFISPQDSRPIVLAPRPQRVDFPVHMQNTVASIEGSGSTYHVHYLVDTTFRISTPGAFTKTSNASTWYFYAKDNYSGKIKLSDNKLMIGLSIIHLPEYVDGDTPVEEIYVATPTGDIYAVNLVFEQVYLHSEK